MISSALWKHLDTHEAYQFLFWYRSPLQWNPSTFRVHANSLTSIRGYAWGICLTLLVAVYAVTFTLLSLLKVFKVTFFATVISFGEIIITVFGSVLGIIAIIDQHKICQCLNGIFRLAREPPKGALLPPLKFKGKLPKFERVMLTLLRLLQNAVTFNPFATLSLPFALTSEPMYFLWDYLLHDCIFENRTIISTLCERLIRGSIMFILGLHLFMDIYQFMTFLLIGLTLQLKLFSFTFVKQRIILATDIRNNKLKTWLITEEFTRSLKFHFVFKIYRRIQLVLALHDEVTLILYPILFALIYAGGVLASFIVIFGYTYVSWIVYIMATVLGVIVAVVFSCIFPRFCDFDLCSSEFRTFWKWRLFRKYDRLRIASLRPIRVRIQPFFAFRKSQYLFMVWNMMSFSITFFLTFKDEFDH